METAETSPQVTSATGNLLGGRAVRCELLPLVSAEIPDFSLDRALNHGLLPSHDLDEAPADLIAAYVGTYLREGILAEHSGYG